MNVAFIPVRGGSKSIPLKNIKPLAGHPLVYWAVSAACDCQRIDRVYVATDNRQIAEVVRNFLLDRPEWAGRLEVVGRSKESASDTASTESAMLEFAESHEFDYIALIQATSPLLCGEDLDRGFELLENASADSVFSAVRQKRFNWSIDEQGFAHAENYDIFNRPRRQDFEGYLVENGAFYITSRERLLNTQNRLSGRIRSVEMGEDTYFEIDEPSDWIVTEGIMSAKKKKNDRPLRIKMFLTDCDGCLTDAGMYYSNRGDELKKFNARDGMGLQLLRESGILTGMVTRENVELNRRRADKLKMDIYEAGCANKLEKLKELAAQYGITLQEIAYIGDDLPDLPCMQAIRESGGVVGCPADAVQQVREIASYVCQHCGGNGAVREFIEWLLKERE